MDLRYRWARDRNNWTEIMFHKILVFPSGLYVINRLGQTGKKEKDYLARRQLGEKILKGGVIIVFQQGTFF